MEKMLGFSTWICIHVRASMGTQLVGLYSLGAVFLLGVSMDMRERSVPVHCIGVRVRE